MIPADESDISDSSLEDFEDAEDLQTGLDPIMADLSHFSSDSDDDSACTGEDEGEINVLKYQSSKSSA